MGNILYLECNSGISGDMTVGALLDLGADREVLEKALSSLGVGGYHLHFGRASKCGIDAYDFDVHLEPERVMPQEETEAEDHSHDHIHRNLFDIYTIIDRLDSGDKVKAMARHMFEIVAEAESKAHGLPVEKVHFHEVGAIDSIVDIISVAVCMDNLGIDQVAVSPLFEGQGVVRCQHGVLPVPVPATANITSAYGLSLRLTENIGEMVTPTGAAIAAAYKNRDSLPDSFRILKIGMGAGKKEFKQANVLRAMILEETPEQADRMCVLEANIDDSTGEMLGYSMEKLLEAGAADVWYTPVYMKKNRPACLLSLICREEEVSVMEDIIFRQTTTIGIRKQTVFRRVLEREDRIVKTDLGQARIKVCSHGDKQFFYPEYESVRKLCGESGLDFQSVYCIIREEAKKHWSRS